MTDTMEITLTVLAIVLFATVIAVVIKLVTSFVVKLLDDPPIRKRLSSTDSPSSSPDGPSVQETTDEEDASQDGTAKFELPFTTDEVDWAYLLYANNRVEELELDDLEGDLGEKLESSLTSPPDIETGGYEYRYFFLYLEDVDDDDREIYLIYTKTGETTSPKFHVLSGIEVYGLGNEIHEDAEAYAGEKRMAEAYVQLRKALSDYTN